MDTLSAYDPGETKQIVAGNQLELLGRYMEQMAAIVAMLRKEVDTLQKNAQQVTVSHQQALQLQRLMRNRRRSARSMIWIRQSTPQRFAALSSVS